MRAALAFEQHGWNLALVLVYVNSTGSSIRTMDVAHFLTFPAPPLPVVESNHVTPVFSSSRHIWDGG